MTGTGGTRRDNLQKVPTGDNRDTPFRGGVPLSPRGSIGAEMHRLARRVGRLSPSWRDPERYFEERDELERALRHLAHQLRGDHG
jgi:hypothetical protein